MLSPKRTKFRKAHKGRIHGLAKGGAQLNFGSFGLKALQDYAGGVFTAPSTYIGLGSFGAGKAGALAAQQGIKYGIKELGDSIVECLEYNLSPETARLGQHDSRPGTLIWTPGNSPGEVGNDPQCARS